MLDTVDDVHGVHLIGDKDVPEPDLRDWLQPSNLTVVGRADGLFGDISLYRFSKIERSKRSLPEKLHFGLEGRVVVEPFGKRRSRNHLQFDQGIDDALLVGLCILLVNVAQQPGRDLYIAVRDRLAVHARQGADRLRTHGDG